MIGLSSLFKIIVPRGVEGDDKLVINGKFFSIFFILSTEKFIKSNRFFFKWREMIFQDNICPCYNDVY